MTSAGRRRRWERSRRETWRAGRHGPRPLCCLLVLPSRGRRVLWRYRPSREQAAGGGADELAGEDGGGEEDDDGNDDDDNDASQWRLTTTMTADRSRSSPAPRANALDAMQRMQAGAKKNAKANYCSVKRAPLRCRPGRNPGKTAASPGPGRSRRPGGGGLEEARAREKAGLEQGTVRGAKM